MTSPTSDRRQGLVGNTPIKAPVDCATTANIVLSGEQVIDGVQTAGSRVLVHNQTDATQNGIYNSSSAAWTRAADADGNYDLTTGTLVSVTGGIAQALAFYQLTTVKPIVIGTSALNWVQVLASGVFTGTVFATPLREVQTMVAGQTLLVLTTMAYVVGNHSLTVLVDGLVEDEADYTQTSPTSITFASPFLGGEQVTAITNSFSTFGSGRAQMNQATTSPTDIGTLVVQRSVEYSGGTPGFVNSAIRADTFVDNAGAAAFEWAVVGAVHNHATAGENVGVYGQGLKYSTGPTWGGTMEAIDWTGQADPTTGLVGLEVDCRANGTDGNHGRVGVDLVVTRPYVNGAPSGAAMQAWFGYRVQTGGDASAAVVASFSTIVSNGVVGFDCSGATLTQGSLKMASGQPILFTAAADRKLYYDGTGFRFSDAANTTIVRFADNGAIQTAGGVQVVGARQTGYTAMTGVTNRGTVYDPSTITLAQLAARVNALQADLTLHGLIGA